MPPKKKEKKPEPEPKPEPKSPSPSPTPTTPSTELKIEESKPLDLEPVEAEPTGATPPAEAAPDGEPGADGVPPPEISKIMVKGIFQTFGKTLEVLTDDPEMDLDEDELTLLEEAWAPLLPEMPPWMMATIATVAVFSKKGMIFAIKLKKKRDKAAKEKAEGKKPESEEPEKPEEKKPEAPAAKPAEPKPEKGGNVLGPAQV